MSDPTIQTFCCHHRTQLDGAIPLMGEFSTNSYLFVCMVSSFLGIMGAHYQIFVRGKQGSASNSRRLTDSGNSVNSNGHRVILWLAIADFCASLGEFQPPSKKKLCKFQLRLFPRSFCPIRHVEVLPADDAKG